MDDLDDVALSADTLKILNEFLNEQKQKEESATTATGLFEQENWVSFNNSLFTTNK